MASALIHVEDDERRTLLTEAALRSHIHAMHTLLIAGADPNHLDARGAAQIGHVQRVRLPPAPP